MNDSNGLKDVIEVPDVKIAKDADPSTAPFVVISGNQQAALKRSSAVAISSLALQFVLEGRDHCESAASGLLNLEKNSRDPQVLNDIFRSFHTIKGTSGIFPEYAAVTTLTHAAEELMDQVRSGGKVIDSESTDLLLAVLDQVGAWLDAVESTGSIPGDAQDRSAQLRAALKTMTGQPGPDSRPDSEAVTATAGTSLLEALLRAWLIALDPTRKAPLATARSSADTALTAFCYIPTPDAFFCGDDPVALIHAIPDLLLLDVARQSETPFDGNYDPFACDLKFLAVAAADAGVVRDVFAFVEDQIALLPCSPDLLESVQTSSQPPPPAAKKTTFIKVDQEHLNSLAELVGRMISAGNSLQYLGKLAATIYGTPKLATEINLQHSTLTTIISGLQNIATEMRLQPVSRAFERFPRLVRDLSRTLDKRVNLVMTGEETVVGKDIIDLLGDTLIHLVRNSLDHGVENPAERTAAGKAEEATITLRAFQDTSGTIVEIEDDGRGIDPALIRRKAVAKGIISSDRAAAMSDEEAIQIIMLPGFSTADAASLLSGRGVGMDAVMNIVTSSGGSIRVFSTPGQGCRMRLVLPKSAAVTTTTVAWQGDLLSRRS
jgi:two-component system chemotaxis sensor kinase CheA